MTVTRTSDLPEGEYGFIELYCDEPGCDCRRVTIVVLRPHTGWKVWATLSYGWESLDFYQKWANTPDPLDPLEWQGPYLDPLAEQTQYAPMLLDLFKVILRSAAYRKRLKNHYQLFRAAMEEECASRNGSQRDRVGRRTTRRQGAKKRG